LEVVPGALTSVGVGDLEGGDGKKSWCLSDHPGVGGQRPQEDPKEKLEKQEDGGDVGGSSMKDRQVDLKDYSQRRGELHVVDAQITETNRPVFSRRPMQRSNSSRRSRNVCPEMRRAPSSTPLADLAEKARDRHLPPR